MINQTNFHGTDSDLFRSHSERKYIIRGRTSASSALVFANDTEKKLQQEYLRQAHSAITQVWNPLSVETFIPRTKLGKKLWKIKQQMILNGETTSDWNQVISTINKARGIE